MPKKYYNIDFDPRYERYMLIPIEQDQKQFLARTYYEKDRYKTNKSFWEKYGVYVIPALTVMFVVLFFYGMGSQISATAQAPLTQAAEISRQQAITMNTFNQILSQLECTGIHSNQTISAPPKIY